MNKSVIMTPVLRFTPIMLEEISKWECSKYNTNFFASPQIDEESPFFEMTPQSLLSSQFEIVVVMEGVTEETGNTVQARQLIRPEFQEESDEIYRVGLK